MTERFINTFCRTLFEHGVETYENDAAGNIGGAKVWNDVPFRTAKSGIHINDPRLDKVLKELPVSVFTLSRVQLNKDGTPQRTKDNSGYNRICSALMVYPQMDENPQTAREYKARILEAMKGLPLEDRVEIASNIDVPEIKALAQIKIRDWKQDFVPLKLDSCIILAVPSGPIGGAQLWSSKTKAATRSAMADRSTANGVETDGLPL